MKMGCNVLGKYKQFSAIFVPYSAYYYLFLTQCQSAKLLCMLVASIDHNSQTYLIGNGKSLKHKNLFKNQVITWMHILARKVHAVEDEVKRIRIKHLYQNHWCFKSKTEMIKSITKIRKLHDTVMCGNVVYLNSCRVRIFENLIIHIR